jgi:NAD(P)-dependent dehydrogenase (short-subunit alcohol dehydrogenase family)
MTAPPAGEVAGRTALVTGATSGIGEAIALGLARRGARVLIVGRNRERGEAALARLRERSGSQALELLLADLGSQREVRRVAAEVLERCPALRLLVNNAGVINLRRRTTVDGLEETFAVNHLAYFLLTVLLLDRLRASAPARIVSVASDAHHYAGGRLDFDDLGSERSYGSMRVYGKSKLANILFTRELARRLGGTGVTANCFHPGFVGSNFGRNNGRLGRVAMTLARPFARTPEKGAETGLYLCVSPEVEGVSGEYFRDRKPRRPAPAALSDEDAARLWAVSERLTA